MNRDNNSRIKELGYWASFAVYIPAAILMYTLTNYLIPYLSRTTGQEAILYWFLVSGLGIFSPLIITGLIILKVEGKNISLKTWTNRLRFCSISKQDFMWSIVGLVFIGVFGAIIMNVLEMIIGKFDHTPPFLSFEPLMDDRIWLLAVWFPYWILNILGEEFLWRGVMLPRQEIAFGKKAWIIHGIGWALFHITFGWQLLITMLPIIFILPFIVQKRKNSWLGVIIHGGINGPSFLAISFGLI